MKAIRQLRHIPLCLLGVCLLAACTNQAQQQGSTDSTEYELIGGDRTPEGCLPSAGESWSRLYERCLQVFNEGERLNPVQVEEGEAVLSAFVLYSPDSTQIELFLPDSEEQPILQQSSPSIYQQGDYQYDAHEGKLYHRGTALYQRENKQH